MVEFSSQVLRVFIVTKVKEIAEASASVGLLLATAVPYALLNCLPVVPDLSKKNRAVPTVCLIVAVLLDLMNGRVSSLQRKGQVANLHRRRFYFTVLKSFVHRTALLLAAVCCDFDSQRYFNQESVTESYCRYKRVRPA